MRNKIILYLNGIKKELGPEHASMMLADYLRYDQGLTGTKIVCAEGDCGACTVLRYFPHSHDSSETYLPVNSCITLLASLDGSSIVTVDALAKDDSLHEAQRAMVQCHGSQCGFCTPGFVMALTGLMEKKICGKGVSITEAEAKNALTGNLCRCTGYQPILDAAVSINLAKAESVKDRFYTEEQKRALNSAFQETADLESEGFSFYAPKTIKEALSYLKDYPQTRIIASATDLGVVHNKRKLKLTKLLSLHLMADFYRLEEKGDFIHVGARVTLAEFRHFLKDKVSEFSHYLDVFASPQIKNIGTVVGNVATASPIGDTPPALLALNAIVVIESLSGPREVELKDFYQGYRKTSLAPGELISEVKFKRPAKNSTLRFFKNANRKDMDISAVNLSINVEWKDQVQNEIEKITIAGGGIAAIPLRFTKTEHFLKGKTLDQKNLDLAVGELHNEFNPLSDLRASSAYRHILIENLFRRFAHEHGVSV
jgi:xanthine dehydrogenase small subunit